MALMSIIVLGVSAIVAWLAWMEYREEATSDAPISRCPAQNVKARAGPSKEGVAERKCSSPHRRQSP
jgi:hypothetical protein